MAFVNDRQRRRKASGVRTETARGRQLAPRASAPSRRRTLCRLSFSMLTERSGPDEEDRTDAAAQNAGGDAAEKQAAQAGVPVRGHCHEVDAGVPGPGDNLLGGVLPKSDSHIDGEAGGAEGLRLLGKGVAQL